MLRRAEPGLYRSWSKGCEGYLGHADFGSGGVRGTWDVHVLEQGMEGVHGVYRSWSKGCEGYMECIGPPPRGMRGTWSVQVLHQEV